MRQVFLQNGKVRLHKIDVPIENEHNLLVQVYYSFVSSGTELATMTASGKSLLARMTKDAVGCVQKVVGAIKEDGFSATVALVKEKLDGVLPIGYSCSGRVVKVGTAVDGFCIGDYVACGGAGLAYHADLVSVPYNLVVKLDSEKFLKQASLTTIGAIALQGIRRANIQLGESVCVLGLGLVGQLTAQLAKLSGARVIGVDIHDERLGIAKKHGVDKGCNALTENVISEIDYITNHHGVDVTIITAATSQEDVLQQAMNITKRKGRVVLVGDVPIKCDRDPFYSKEIDFLISCSYGPGRYDDTYEKLGRDYPYAYVRWTENRNMVCFAHLIQEKKINVDSLITHEFNIDQCDDAYIYLKKGLALGIVLSYEPAQTAQCDCLTASSIAGKMAQVRPFIATHDVAKVGFIGVGGFAKVRLLPIISKLRNIQIHTIVDIDSVKALNIARQYGAQRFMNNYDRLLCDEEVSVAIIATPHAVHAQQALHAMQNGKAVFVEKPAAVTMEQYLQLKNFFAHSNKNHLYCVDFNRSFSPFMQAIKEVIKTRHNPLLIHYRMNAGYLPKNHWIHAPENGGRIIGEACHIFELFCFLTDAVPVAVSVESLNTPHEAVIATDNFVAQISMSDGSCCSLIYSSIGNNSMGKERMELFFDGKSIVMNDFIELRGYGLPVAFNRNLHTPDKGHEHLLYEFFKVVRGQRAQSPVPVERILCATELSLIVDKLARAGGGCDLIKSKST